jgi:hypothetical protein
MMVFAMARFRWGFQQRRQICAAFLASLALLPEILQALRSCDDWQTLVRGVGAARGAHQRATAFEMVLGLVIRCVNQNSCLLDR